MKPTLLLLFLCLNVPAWAQIFQIDSLPAKGVFLNKGWRWKAGNVPNAATPQLDDSGWANVSAQAEVDSLPGLRQQHTGWARIRFELGTRMANVPMQMRVYQRGAARIYLDGRLLKQYGQIGSDGQATALQYALDNDYITLPPLPAGPHWLAIQLALPPLPWYVPSNIQESPVVGVGLRATEGLVKTIADRTFWKALNHYLLVGFFLALAAVQLLYFLYRRQPISLIFSLTMLLGAMQLALGDISRYVANPVALEWLAMGRLLSLVLLLASLLLTYHMQLQARLGWFFWVGTALMLANVFIGSYTQFAYSNALFSIGIAAMFASGMSLSVRAVKQKKADGWVTLSSMGFLIVAMTIQLFINLLFPKVFAAYADPINELTELIFIVTPPLTLALLLARDHARTNDELARNLAEVRQLSGEKEAILTQQKAMLEEQVAARTAELQRSLEELRTTQQQLVQREKMASLGELTAGIAHEIQNPLNFVNNFTEVSAELVQELAEERTRRGLARPSEIRDEVLQDELISDLAQNLTKISHHGQRAANIVRGMLEHSRSSSGQRESTDLNALANEYLNLSYHGLKAKDKNFSANLTTNFDAELPLVPVVSQDIGRVLLNLFNNAFYAVKERAATAKTDYDPTVSVQTYSQEGKVCIQVIDNGTGIPAAVRDKIFQPFFTTKPTGQGTGLGLSISYDIITKGHAGTLRVTSEEGAGTTFVIELPIGKSDETANTIK